MAQRNGNTNDSNANGWFHHRTNGQVHGKPDAESKQPERTGTLWVSRKEQSSHHSGWLLSSVQKSTK